MLDQNPENPPHPRHNPRSDAGNFDNTTPAIPTVHLRWKRRLIGDPILEQWFMRSSTEGDGFWAPVDVVD